jgi:integrase
MLSRASSLVYGAGAQRVDPGQYRTMTPVASTGKSPAMSRCAAIRYAHRLADLEPPTASEHVRATLRGIRRAVGAAPARKAPVLAEQARAMADAAPANLKGLRDRALLLLGFAGAFRRSELVALDVADLRENDDGFRVLIGGQRPTRRATARRSPSCAATTPVR